MTGDLPLQYLADLQPMELQFEQIEGALKAILEDKKIQDAVDQQAAETQGEASVELEDLELSPVSKSLKAIVFRDLEIFEAMSGTPLEDVFPKDVFGQFFATEDARPLGALARPHRGRSEGDSP